MEGEVNRQFVTIYPFFLIIKRETDGGSSSSGSGSIYNRLYCD
jgi:hypothetical protein